VAATVFAAGGVTRAQSNPPSAARPLTTAFVDPVSFPSPAAFARARAAGATFVRLILWWPGVAPGGSQAPTPFDARDPADPAYRWSDFDAQVRMAVAKGLQPIVDIVRAPPWAQSGAPQRASDGPVRPSPAALGDFAAAAAQRYSGSFGGLPRVRYWQVWNEPNLSVELVPQTENGKPVSPGWYRSMVNAMAKAVHAVRKDNIVIAGGLAPFGGDTNDPSGGNVPEQERIHPLQFMRQMLCMSEGATPKPTCNQRTEFDVWGHNPYTYGGPTHKAFHRDDVSIGDLGEMRTLLVAAAKAGNITPRREPGFWVTEFSYDSKPADPKGLTPVLHARWVSEALYRMWSSGVSLVSWWLVSDQPFPDGMFQSGVYSKDDRPKSALRAFRFPFVAFSQNNGTISYWGRTPTSKKQAVVVEQKTGNWRRIAVPLVDRYGIFSGRIENVKGSGSLRARLATGKDFSQPFSLKVVKDFRFCPWGSFC